MGKNKDTHSNLSADNAMLRRHLRTLSQDNIQLAAVNNDLTMYIATLVMRDLKNGVTTKIAHEELAGLHNRRVAISTIAIVREDLKEKGDNFFDRELVIDVVDVGHEKPPSLIAATEEDLQKIEKESKVIEIASR